MEPTIEYRKLSEPAQSIEKFSDHILTQIVEEIPSTSVPQLIKAVKIRFGNVIEDRMRKLQEDLEINAQIMRELNNL